MKGTPVTEEIVDYMIRMFPAEDELLAGLREQAAIAGLPPIQISPEQAAFMQTLLLGIDARRIVEVGTLGGYSAIVMARALPADGELITIERDPLRADFAREQIRRAGMDSIVRVVVGSGVDVLERELADSGPFDFAFIDADKPGYVRYLELIYPLMRRGGLIAGDNALAWGKIADADTEDPDVRGMQAFNKAMASHPGIQASLVPIGDGMCIGVVL
ncbi:MAG TPA: O-methyltransferase [Candidatus Kapabacteria bacterium]|nr:O-methyltransferase [Candidatus Kapabacteria bacterium]